MKLTLVAATAMVLMLPVAALAQVPMMPGAFEISAGGGMSVPTGDLGLAASAGYALGVNGAFYAMPNLAVGATIMYNSYGADETLTSLVGTEVTWSILEFGAYGKYTFMPGPVTPYAKASVGYFRSTASASGTSDSRNDLGIGGGLGAQFRLPTSNIGFFAEGMANSIFADGSSINYYSIRGGINLYVNPKP